VVFAVALSRRKGGRKRTAGLQHFGTSDGNFEPFIVRTSTLDLTQRSLSKDSKSADSRSDMSIYFDKLSNSHATLASAEYNTLHTMRPTLTLDAGPSMYNTLRHDEQMYELMNTPSHSYPYDTLFTPKPPLYANVMAESSADI
jgi:hypothetical protein